MQFVTQSEATAFFRVLGIGVDGLLPGSRAATTFKSVELSYRSRLASASEVALAIAHACGQFSNCMVWPTALVWGDRSCEENAPRDWIDYREWRQSFGEARKLKDAPGHLFEAGETQGLARLIELAIHMGWDAIVGARPNKFLLALSHNDRITLYARSHPTALIGELKRLGLNVC